MHAAVNDTELFFTIEGRHDAAPPLMLMHGPGFDHTYFRPWTDPLGQKRPVIYFDSRGNGRSARADVGRATIDSLVKDIDALRGHLNYDRIVIHGHSFAGPIALAYAIEHAGHLAGLILDCTAPAFDYQPVMMANLAARATKQQQQQLTEAFTGQLRDDEAFRSAWELVLPLYFNQYDPEIGTRMMGPMQFSAQAFNHISSLVLSMNMQDVLREIRTPTLILAGRHDWICPPAQGAERLREGLTNSRLAIFERSGHFPFIEEQDAYLHTVDEWLLNLN